TSASGSLLAAHAGEVSTACSVAGPSAMADRERLAVYADGSVADCVPGAVATTVPPLERSKRTPVTPPGACALAPTINVPSANAAPTPKAVNAIGFFHPRPLTGGAAGAVAMAAAGTTRGGRGAGIFPSGAAQPAGTSSLHARASAQARACSGRTAACSASETLFFAATSINLSRSVPRA